MPRARLFRAALALCLMAGAIVAPTASAALDEVNTQRLRNAVTISGILQHERALQRIANQNDGTRASGTPGYDASAEYVKNRLERAGYEVTEQEFTFPFFRDLAAPTLTVDGTEYETGTLDLLGQRRRDGDAASRPTTTSSRWTRTRRQHVERRAARRRTSNQPAPTRRSP